MGQSYLLLDVGGTQIKAGVAGADGEIRGGTLSFPAKAKAGMEEILCNFAGILEELQRKAGGDHVYGVGMAFPGPFDYENGVSRMQGLDKYDSIYGISLETEIKRLLPSARDWKFCFLHDVEAFALGVSRYGAAKDEKKLLCLCIGTGAGSAFIKDRRALKEEKDGAPPNGWIYDTPYRASVIDDYLSVRGLAALSMEMTGQKLDGKELYERCLNEDADALLVYEAFGRDLTGSILPYLDTFAPDAVVFGGQISKSFSFFGREFESICRERGIAVYLEPETSVRAMQGLFMKMK